MAGKISNRWLGSSWNLRTRAFIRPAKRQQFWRTKTYCIPCKIIDRTSMPSVRIGNKRVRSTEHLAVPFGTLSIKSHCSEQSALRQVGHKRGQINQA
jgi:hypothetical protein